jgi:pimeloyl-ACP methyl ester carboxylesterase
LRTFCFRIRPMSLGFGWMSAMTREFDVRHPDGRTLHAYDNGPVGGFPVMWHHGTNNVGAPPRPLFDLAARLGLRWLSYDRPGYGGSTLRPDRDIASAANDVAAVLDALGVDRFAAVGHSGGGPHALACAASLPDRVASVVSIAGPAPRDADGLDWFAGMAVAGVASNRAAAEGRSAREAYEESGADDDFGFTAEDERALGERWSWVLDVVRPAMAAGPGGMVDDDLAAAMPWGFDPGAISAPVLLVHGGRDRVVPSTHSAWLAERVPHAELRTFEADGHITVLDHLGDALEWIHEQVQRTR